VEIDGSLKSGSGTILRLSIALSGILNEPLHIYNIRQKRRQPGLRPQHLEAVITAARICDAEINGAVLNSQELWFKPRRIVGGDIRADIGTAGSIPMLILTILPICAFAKQATRVHIHRGGTDVRYSPTINYLKNVLLPVLEKMGLKTSLSVHSYGYYPKGMGEVSLEIQPTQKLKPLRLEEFGKTMKLKGISVCTYLAHRRVAQRQADAANDYLKSRGCEAKIQIINDTSNPLQKGSSLVLWEKTDTNALIGGDAIGELRKPSETVGLEAAKNLFEEHRAQATADIHLADMLVPYVALANGESTYLARAVTEHLSTNIWLVQEILGVEFKVTRIRSLYCINKIK
jgi:RNA 3'-terminal phosphate cyclase (ATP)